MRHGFVRNLCATAQAERYSFQNLRLFSTILSKFACISGLRPEEMPYVLSKMKNTIYEKNIRDIYVECLRAAGVAGGRRILLHP